MNEHLKIQKKSNPHTLFFCFWSWKHNCGFLASASTIAKIDQFGKEHGRYGVLSERGLLLDDEWIKID
jgi:hypothetical protein